MQIAIEEIQSPVTPAQVEALLPLVSEQRREQALRFKHLFGQYACLRTYCMLADLLEKHYGVKDANLHFSYNEYGKPSLTRYPHIHFSISHCRTALAVAVDDSEIGVDVESIREASSELIERVMNEEEQSLIRSSSDPNRAFITLWTRKEAVLKLRGTGIVDNLREVLTIHPTDAVETKDMPHYVCSAACNCSMHQLDIKLKHQI